MTEAGPPARPEPGSRPRLAVANAPAGYVAEYGPAGSRLCYG
jgi:hypothetical protein